VFVISFIKKRKVKDNGMICGFIIATYHRVYIDTHSMAELGALFFAQKLNTTEKTIYQ
jgi:hypothetical protein